VKMIETNKQRQQHTSSF